jgi:hypothetical protein
MRPNENNGPAGRRPRRHRFELFFFEQVGSSRTYLRFTNLALFLVLFLTLGAMATIIALFLWNSSHEPQETDVNIHPVTHESTNYNGPVISRAPRPYRHFRQNRIPTATLAGRGRRESLG